MDIGSEGQGSRGMVYGTVPEYSEGMGMGVVEILDLCDNY